MGKLDLQSRLYEIEGSFNVRDLGGYPAKDGRVVRFGRFIRAGSLSGLTPKGRRALLDLEVRCIVDLRSRFEVEAMPDAVQNDDAFTWHHVSMLDYINSNIAGGNFRFPESMEQMYLGLLDEAQDAFRRLFEIFADPACEGYLFHCTAGKDRTGITSMLLLSLAGVAEEDIVEDYSHSESLLPDFGGAPHGPSYLRSSAPQTMRSVLRHLERRYGGPRGYLSRIGVTPEQCAAVTAKLLD